MHGRAQRGYQRSVLRPEVRHGTHAGADAHADTDATTDPNAHANPNAHTDSNTNP
jgi:hypothetical protein